MPAIYWFTALTEKTELCISDFLLIALKSPGLITSMIVRCHLNRYRHFADLNYILLLPGY